MVFPLFLTERLGEKLLSSLENSLTSNAKDCRGSCNRTCTCFAAWGQRETGHWLAAVSPAGETLHAVQFSSVSLNYCRVWVNTTKILLWCGMRKACPSHVCLHLKFSGDKSYIFWHFAELWPGWNPLRKSIRAWVAGSWAGLFLTSKATAAAGLQYHTGKKATGSWMTLSDTSPSCQTWLQGVKGASKSGLLLRAPFAVEPLQTISSWASGSHLHLQRSVLVFWTFLTLNVSLRKWKLPPLTCARWKHGLWSSQWLRFSLVLL